MIHDRLTPNSLRGPVAAFTLVLFAAAATGLGAQEVPCRAVDRDDQPRNCTFMERYGQCVWEANEAYHQCREDAEGGFDFMGCDLARIVDGIACDVAAPFSLLRGLRD